jgi:capsular polysaccharide transport system permease protein
MRSLLEAREVRAGKTDLGDIAKLKQGATAERRYRSAPSFRASARAKANIIAALVMRDIRTRYGRNRLGFLWALFEPMAHIAILAVVFAVTMRTNPPLGSNYLLFYLTGVAPYLLFNHISSSGGHGISGGRNLMQLPGIAPTDIVVAKGVVELFISALVLIIFGLGFVAAGIPGLPANPGPVFAAFGMAFAMGVGTAGIYATFFEFGKLVDMVFKALFRAMYLTSGIFFLPATVPEGLRTILVWNPFVHIIDLARTGYYPFYDSSFTDVPFALLASLFILVIGLGLIGLATPMMRSAR